MYSLRLGNEQSWLLQADKEFQPWLRKFAAVMRLKPSEPNGHPKIVFTHVNSIDGAGRDSQNLIAMRIGSNPRTKDIICGIGEEAGHEFDIIRMWHSLNPVYHKALAARGLPLHAALIEKNGKGILLAGPGDTGKSTCCRRVPPPWKALCDDESLVVLNKRRRYLVHPFPTWSDRLYKRSQKTWDVESHLPLLAVFFLKQAKADKAIRLGQARAAALINESAAQILSRSLRGLDARKEKRLRLSVFDNACRLAKTIPAYTLNFTRNGRFWDSIEEKIGNA
ncbi:MAG: SynChlorMet cassette protein ScmC [Candidatus Omnitrophica bacterium]|nr:SynChlorMet cassette protein ScmC [Candidatus Omnitrophota bacterium]